MSDDMTTRIQKKLFEPVTAGTTMKDEGLRSVLLDQYNTYVDLADRISTRRESANNFALGINTGLIGLIGYTQANADSPVSGGIFWAVAAAGIILNWVWYRIVRSYRDLNTAKFKVVHEIEKQLVISPFDAEWEAVGRGKNSELYLPLTHIEIWVPRIFAGLYLVVLFQVIPWARLRDLLS